MQDITLDLYRGNNTAMGIILISSTSNERETVFTSKRKKNSYVQSKAWNTLKDHSKCSVYTIHEWIYEKKSVCGTLGNVYCIPVKEQRKWVFCSNLQSDFLSHFVSLYLAWFSRNLTKKLGRLGYAFRHHVIGNILLVMRYYTLIPR